MKKWYKSKMIWANILALIAAFGFELSGEEMTAVLAVINIVLRTITKEELVW